MTVRCSNLICKLHLDDDTCSLNSIRVQVVEVEDFYMAVCANEMPRKIQYGLGEYYIRMEDGTIKVVKGKELCKELPE